jgi:hypothetical protein
VAVGAKGAILKLRKEMFLKDELEYFFKQLCSMNVSVVELSAMYNEYITNNHKQDIQ